MRAGAQLRLLNSLPRHGKALVAELTAIAEQEAGAARSLPSSHAAGAAAAAAGLVGHMGGSTDGLVLAAAAGGEESGGWLGLGGAGEEDDEGACLLLTSDQLQQVSQGRTSGRNWGFQMCGYALQRCWSQGQGAQLRVHAMPSPGGCLGGGRP